MKAIIPTLATMGVVVALLAYVVVSQPSPSEHLSAGIDQSNPSSSYDQKTNHFDMPSYNPGPIEGHETPYRVNQWSSYEV